MRGACAAGTPLAAAAIVVGIACVSVLGCPATRKAPEEHLVKPTEEHSTRASVDGGFEDSPDRWVVSPSGAHTLSLGSNREGALLLLVGLIGQDTRSSCGPEPGGPFIPAHATVRWGAADRVVVIWGAGSSDSVARVLDVNCTVRLEVSAPSVEMSPDGKSLVAYSGIGSPLAGRIQPTLYDIRLAGPVASAGQESCSVLSSITWTSEGVILACGDRQSRIDVSLVRTR
jgi:hypothetical protein